jgi:hypothetical protein
MLSCPFGAGPSGRITDAKHIFNSGNAIPTVRRPETAVRSSGVIISIWCVAYQSVANFCSYQLPNERQQAMLYLILVLGIARQISNQEYFLFENSPYSGG